MSNNELLRAFPTKRRPGKSRGKASLPGHRNPLDGPQHGGSDLVVEEGGLFWKLGGALERSRNQGQSQGQRQRARSKARLGSRAKVKGVGQECPPHTGSPNTKSKATEKSVRPVWDAVYSLGKTILGWKRVPARRVAMARRLACPAKTFTWRARETSGRLAGRPLRMRAAVGSSAVTEGNCGRSWRGWMKSDSKLFAPASMVDSRSLYALRRTAGSSTSLPFPCGKAKLRSE